MGKGGGGGGNNQSPFPRNFGEAQALLREQERALQNTLQQTAELNLFDVVTPFGTQQFVGTPGAADFRQEISLPGVSQDLLEQQRQLGAQQFGAFRPVFTQPVGGANLADSAGALEQATYERGLNLLQPQLDRERNRVENSLIQRGTPRDSEAWRAEMGDLERRQGAQLENLALSSVAAGRAEQSRQIQSDIQRRTQLANELGLFGFGGMARSPQFQPVPTFQSQAPDVLGTFGLLSSNQQAAANRRAQQEQSALGGLFNIGAGLISLF